MQKNLYPDQLHPSIIDNNRDSHFLVSSPTFYQNGQHLFKLLFHRASMKLFHNWLLENKYHSKIVPIKQSSSYERHNYSNGRGIVKVSSLNDVLPLAKKWVLNNYCGVGKIEKYRIPHSYYHVKTYLENVVEDLKRGITPIDLQAVYWLLLEHNIITNKELDTLLSCVPDKYRLLLEPETVPYNVLIQNPYNHTKRYVNRGMIPNILLEFECYGATQYLRELATYFAITQTHPDEIYMFLKSHCVDHSPDRTRHKVNELIELQKSPMLRGSMEWDALVWTFVHKTQCNKRLYTHLQDMDDILRSRYFMVAERLLK